MSSRPARSARADYSAQFADQRKFDQSLIQNRLRRARAEALGLPALQGVDELEVPDSEAQLLGPRIAIFDGRIMLPSLNFLLWATATKRAPRHMFAHSTEAVEYSSKHLFGGDGQPVSRQPASFSQYHHVPEGAWVAAPFDPEYEISEAWTLRRIDGKDVGLMTPSRYCDIVGMPRKEFWRYHFGARTPALAGLAELLTLPHTSDIHSPLRVVGFSPVATVEVALSSPKTIPYRLIDGAHYAEVLLSETKDTIALIDVARALSVRSRRACRATAADKDDALSMTLCDPQIPNPAYTISTPYTNAIINLRRTLLPVSGGPESTVLSALAAMMQSVDDRRAKDARAAKRTSIRLLREMSNDSLIRDGRDTAVRRSRWLRVNDPELSTLFASRRLEALDEMREDLMQTPPENNFDEDDSSYE